MKPMFVGQAPGKHKVVDSELASAIAARMAKRCGIEPSLMTSSFEAMNLLDDYHGKSGKGDAFPMKAGEGIKIVSAKTEEGQLVLMLGRAVAKACGVKGKANYLEQFEWEGRRAAVIPHPSGIHGYPLDADIEKGYRSAIGGALCRRWQWLALEQPSLVSPWL